MKQSDNFRNYTKLLMIHSWNVNKRRKIAIAIISKL